MDIHRCRVGVLATATDAFFEEARSRGIWAAMTADSYQQIGVNAELIANASRTPIAGGPDGRWRQIEVKEFYGTKNYLPLRSIYEPSPDLGGDAERMQWLYRYGFGEYVIKHFDLLHTRDPKAAFVASASGVPVIIEDHDETFQRDERADVAAFTHELACKLVICICEPVKREYVELGADRSKLVVLDSGVNTNIYVPEERPPAVTRKNNKITVGYAGGLQPERDMENVLMVAEEFTDFDFLFLGGRSKLLNSLQKESGKQGRQNVHFIGFHRAAEVQKLLREKADILLYSRASGEKKDISSPLKLFEYMSFSKPIVSAETEVTERYSSLNGIFAYEPSNRASLKSALESARRHVEQNLCVDIAAFARIVYSQSWLARQEVICQHLST